MAAAAQAPEAKPFLALPVLWLNSGQAAQKKAARTNPTRQTKIFTSTLYHNRKVLSSGKTHKGRAANIAGAAA